MVGGIGEVGINSHLKGPRLVVDDMPVEHVEFIVRHGILIEERDFQE